MYYNSDDYAPFAGSGHEAMAATVLRLSLQKCNKYLMILSYLPAPYDDVNAASPFWAAAHQWRYHDRQ